MAKIDEFFTQLRQQRLARKQPVLPPNSRGISRARAVAVLGEIGLATGDIPDVVMALLDDTLPSMFTPLETTHRFSDGATTAHIACHVGILQRGSTKMDREGRDYWIKPLREAGAVEPITLPKGHEGFVTGHIIAKSPASSYRLTESFIAVLMAPEADLRVRVKEWNEADARRQRLALQAEAAQKAKVMFADDHGELIADIVKYFAPSFLVGYELIYIDQDDGDRVRQDEKTKLEAAGITLTLADAFPDVMYFNFTTRMLWCVEAVTSDGEVDSHKVEAVQRLCTRCGIGLAGLTTAYTDWPSAARRQGKYRNIAPGTCMWIRNDPAKHWEAHAAFAKARS